MDEARSAGDVHPERPLPPSPPAAQPSRVLLRGPEDLEPFKDRWDQLARAAIEPNPYLESWMLLPALRSFRGGEEVEVALVERHDGALIGFFPLVRARRWRALSIPTLGLWRHDYSFLSTPLVHRAHGKACLLAFLDWLYEASGATIMEFAGISGDGPFRHLLTDILNDRVEEAWTVERYTRGLYMPRADADRYLALALDGHTRRRLRNQERRLGDLGRVRYDALSPDGDVEAWIDEFLCLEKSGWKGQAGTAMASDPVRRRYFESIVREAFHRGQLDMLALRLDGRPVALKCNLRSGDGAFIFKIAYDEGYAKFSPGMLLEVHDIRRLHDRREVRWVDSCASKTSPLFRTTCIDRRLIETVLVPTGRAPGRLLLSLLPVAQWGVRSARKAARRARQRLS